MDFAVIICSVGSGEVCVNGISGCMLGSWAQCWWIEEMGMMRVGKGIADEKTESDIGPISERLNR